MSPPRLNIGGWQGWFPVAKKKKTNIRYEPAPDIQARFADIVMALDLRHIDLERTVCLRSRGSSSRRVLGRCHGLGRAFQAALGIKAFYVLEFIAERFDALDEAAQEEVIIHELLHISQSFGGGFRHHDVVTGKRVRQVRELYRRAKAAAV
ncbi:MAG: putative metallopeptidase [Acidobacteriota bacterium]|nr:putative metallopeptidase [Acidobacteriota bacterium]